MGKKDPDAKKGKLNFLGVEFKCCVSLSYVINPLYKDVQKTYLCEVQLTTLPATWNVQRRLMI